MGVSICVVVITVFFNLLAFLLAIGAEKRRSTAVVVQDQYDEKSYCRYDKNASTAYGLAAFGLLLISQTVVHGVTKCFCFGRGMMAASSSTTLVPFFIFSWISFLATEACLLAGSAKNAYHTKYRAVLHVEHLSCATLRKGVFAAGAALTLVTTISSIFYYWIHAKTHTGGWERQSSEGLGLTSTNFTGNPQNVKGSGP